MPKSSKPRKRYQPKPVISDSRLITAPTHPDRVVDYAVKIGMLADRITSGTWTGTDFNNAVHVVNIVERVIFRHYSIDEDYGLQLTAKYQDALNRTVGILENVRKRRSKAGNYGISGDERSPLVANLIQLAEIAHDVSLAQFLCAEEDALRLGSSRSKLPKGSVAAVWRP